jgi:predicted DNA-binding protein
MFLRIFIFWLKNCCFFIEAPGMGAGRLCKTLWKQQMTTLKLELDDSIFQLLDQTASALGKSPIDVVRVLVTYYLEDLEDMRLASDALNRLENGESYAISLNELESRLCA